MKKITFAVPSYNSAPFLHYALDSLIPAGDQIEVLVIDDGSRDATLDVAKDYERRYPDIFRAVHEENGGHGEAINTALKLATGRYFKVLDSDDWVSKEALEKLLSFLDAHPDEADLILMDYQYWRGHEEKTTRIRFGRYLKEETVTTFDHFSHLRVQDNLTLHSTLYKTEVLRQAGLNLPKHMSYEDNLMVYTPLPFVHSLVYLPYDLYQYQIGRAGQSMERETLLRKWKDYVILGKKIFALYDIMPYRKTNKGLYRVMKHHLVMNCMFVPLFCQLKDTDESRAALKDFYAFCKEQNPKQYKMIRKDIKVSALSLPGKSGTSWVRFWYWLAHKVVKFN